MRTRRLARGVIVVTVAAAALVVAITAGTIWWYRAPGLSSDPAALTREILALRAERDRLEARVQRIDARDALLGARPAGDVLLALPAPFVERLAQDIVRGWFSEVDLRLRNLRVQKRGVITAKLGFLGRRRVGAYALRLAFDEVTGTLAPGVPTIAVEGERIAIRLPVRLVGGRGAGRATLAWDSQGLARGVCGDLEASRLIDGSVEPGDHVAVGELRLAAQDGGLLIDPRFPGLSLRLRVRPSARAIAVLNEVLQSQGRLCDFAIEQADVEARVLALLARGFDVKIPQRFFRPVRVPFAFDGVVPIVGTTLLLTATAETLLVTPRAVWLAANVEITGAVKGPVETTAPRLRPNPNAVPATSPR